MFPPFAIGLKRGEIYIFYVGYKSRDSPRLVLYTIVFIENDLLNAQAKFVGYFTGHRIFVFTRKKSFKKFLDSYAISLAPKGILMVQSYVINEDIVVQQCSWY